MDQAPTVVSRRFGDPDAWQIDRYRRTGGYRGLEAALRTSPAAVRAEVELSGLTGRSGGSAFPTARKWAALPDTAVPYVIANGDESEPGFAKDRALMNSDPHLLIEGLLICAYAVGARLAVVYLRGEFAGIHERVITAVDAAYAAGLAGRNIADSDFSCDVLVHVGAGAYIVGEETALIESLEGNRGFPRIRPPYPTDHGLYGQPTVVNNVETLATLPWILDHGGDRYRELGGGRFVGSRLFALSGRVNQPGVYEVELHHRTFRDLVFDPSLGGGVPDGADLTAFIPGASFPWLFADHLDLHLDGDELAQHGSSLGAGVVVLDETVCPVRVAWRLVRFFARESCGQCTPCREGTTWLAQVMARIEGGQGRREDLDLLLDVGDHISPGPFPHPARPHLNQPAVPWPYAQTTICALGPSAVSPIDSSIHAFRDVYLRHITESRCPWRRS